MGGARIIGTDASIFQLRPSQNDPPSFVLAEGNSFAAPFELVLGAKAAAELGLAIGDQFYSQHGVEVGLESDHHDMPHLVVGILAPSNTAYDSAVFTPLESVWLVHEDHDDHDEEAYDHHEEQTSDDLELFDFSTPSASEQITAVLVKPTGFGEANELWRDLRLGSEAQAAFPGQELGNLFDLLNQGQQI